MALNVVEFRSHTVREVVPTLKKIIEEIEAGKFGEIGALGVVLMGDEVEVFGMGPDSEGPAIAILLHAGFMQLSNAITNHGRG